MDEIKERFLEVLEFYPHNYAVKIKQTLYEDLGNVIVTNPQGFVHHVFLPKREDPFRFELLSALVVLGEKHHLLSTDYYDDRTREEFYDHIGNFNRLVQPIRFAWAGRVAAEHSPDPDKLLEETLKKIEVEYLNALYRGNRQAALEVLPLVAFAKGLDADWDFFNNPELNRLLNDLVRAEPGVSNLVRFARKLTRFIPFFGTFRIKKDPVRGLEVFSLDL
ncbi:MAG: hypothetical protein GXO08_02315 [Aquificae bacterium]|nr:hypothetical protein [Aquificota bacterium]